MMKQIILLVTLFLFHLRGQAQTDNKTTGDGTYAIVQVLTPPTVFGEFKIRIFYGDDNIEDFKFVEYSKKTRDLINNDITNALNYMRKKGYKLVQTLTYTWSYVEIQYVMQKS